MNSPYTDVCKEMLLEIRNYCFFKEPNKFWSWKVQYLKLTDLNRQKRGQTALCEEKKTEWTDTNRAYALRTCTWELQKTQKELGKERRNYKNVAERFSRARRNRPLNQESQQTPRMSPDTTHCGARDSQKSSMVKRHHTQGMLGKAEQRGKTLTKAKMGLYHAKSTHLPGKWYL